MRPSFRPSFRGEPAGLEKPAAVEEPAALEELAPVEEPAQRPHGKKEERAENGKSDDKKEKTERKMGLCEQKRENGKRVLIGKWMRKGAKSWVDMEGGVTVNNEGVLLQVSNAHELQCGKESAVWELVTRSCSSAKVVFMTL